MPNSVRAIADAGRAKEKKVLKIPYKLKKINLLPTSVVPFRFRSDNLGRQIRREKMFRPRWIHGAFL